MLSCGRALLESKQAAVLAWLVECGTVDAVLVSLAAAHTASPGVVSACSAATLAALGHLASGAAAAGGSEHEAGAACRQQQAALVAALRQLHDGGGKATVAGALEVASRLRQEALQPARALAAAEWAWHQQAAQRDSAALSWLELPPPAAAPTWGAPTLGSGRALPARQAQVAAATKSACAARLSGECWEGDRGEAPELQHRACTAARQPSARSTIRSPGTATSSALATTGRPAGTGQPAQLLPTSGRSASAAEPCLPVLMLYICMMVDLVNSRRYIVHAPHAMKEWKRGDVRFPPGPVNAWTRGSVSAALRIGAPRRQRDGGAHPSERRPSDGYPTF